MARDQLDGVTVTVPGLARLGRDLRKLGEDTADLKDANKAAGEVVAREAATRAPRGPTGNLAGSGRASRAVGRATVVFGGARVPYAGVIHYGWPARGIEAQPFVFDAADATRPEWLALYQAGVDEALSKLDNRRY